MKKLPIGIHNIPGIITQGYTYADKTQFSLKYLKFAFITGISRFSKVYLLSGGNHLNDVSMDVQYADMMGYTQEEIEQNFDEYLQ